MDLINNSSNNIKIGVIGLGYVGLTLALTLSECGVEVYGIENNLKIAYNIKKSRPHFYEKGLVLLLTKQLDKGNFKCLTSIPLDKNISNYIISVGTDVDKNNQPNFSQLKNVSIEIGQILKKGDLVILRSTVSVGATREFVIPILEQKSRLRAGEDFFIAFAPERTVEGNALHELKFLPQVLAGLNIKSTNKATKIFKLFTSDVVVLDSLEEAEMVKIVSNTYRDLTFAFANELAMICDLFNISTNKIIEASNYKYKRNDVPKPSPGVGGYCLTKDPYLLKHSAKQRGYDVQLSVTGRKVNQAMIFFLHNKIIKFLNKYHQGAGRVRKVSFLGFAFKGDPPTSDVRFSPTIDLVNLLKQNKNIKLYVHDCLVSQKTINDYDVRSVKNVNSCFKDKHCVIIMHNNSVYEKLDIINLIGLMTKPAFVIDPWSLLNHDQLVNLDNVFYSNLGFDNLEKK